MLANLENKLDFRHILTSICPATISFLRGEKSIALAGIKSISSFVSHDKSAASTNQADLFDFVLEREGKVKHLSLYKERRFTKLDYSCASILDAFPYLEMVINRTHLSNQHVDMVRLLLDSEFFLSELNVLAYFTHKVTLPLLNAVEVSTQQDLCNIFPQLYKDLSEGSMNTLDNFSVQYRHVTVITPSSDMEKALLKEMCHHAAKCIELQCGREYGFGNHTDESDPPRATQIYKLTPAEKDGLETNNIPAERHLGVFDKRAICAKSCNYKCKVKSLRDNMVLHNSSFHNTPDHQLKQVLKFLNAREVLWNNGQKELHRKKIMENLEKAKKQSNYTNKLLQQCKSWRGPVTTIEERIQIIQNKPDKIEQIVRVELSYYRDTHKSDVIANAHLFKLNKVTHEERLANLSILLSDKSSGI